MKHEDLYNETFRPQFHFTAAKNWLNDPNGCVYHNGVYHLFFQHNPLGLEWGNMTWGHAVSLDLVYWQQMPNAIEPYDGGTIFSGSVVVDSANRSGLGSGGSEVLVAVYTHARKPFGQAIAFSSDEGDTWQLYEGGRHVVANQGLNEGERDPKVFWHEPSGKWIMVLWVCENQVRFFNSDNLLVWNHTGDFVGEGFYECPDLIKLPLDGNAGDTRWVLYDAAFHYWIGLFDGKTFTVESGPLKGDFGNHFYAGQTWNNTGSRVVQIGWMKGGEYPGMPFNQQMSFPCELSLRKTGGGIRLFRKPVDEIKSLYVESDTIISRTVETGKSLSIGKPGKLFDIEASLQPSTGSGFKIKAYNQEIFYQDNQIDCLGKSAKLHPVDGIVRLRLLIDRTSIELFGNDGEVCMSSCFLPATDQTTVQIDAGNGSLLIHNMVVNQLRSAWQPTEYYSG